MAGGVRDELHERPPAHAPRHPDHAGAGRRARDQHRFAIPSSSRFENIIISNSIRAAVIGLTKTLSQQFGTDGITFNNVLPGTILTDRVHQTSRTQAEREGISVEEAIERGGKTVPMGRIGQPKDLGSLVVFLASAHAEWITGTSIQVDGGAYKGLM